MLFYVAFRNLFRNVRRTCAVMLTIALGAGALMCFDGFNKGVLDQYREGTIHAHYGYGQIFTKGYRENVFEKPWEHWIQNWEALKTFLEIQGGVDKAFPRLSFSALLTSGKTSVSGQGHGVDGRAEVTFFNELDMESGVPLSDQDEGIVLGKGIARALDVNIGDKVTVAARATDGNMNQIALQVVGIFHSGSQEFDNKVFRLPLQQSQKLLKTDKIETIALGLKDLSEWESVAKAIHKRYENLEAIPFAVLDEVYYQHSIDWLDAQFRVVQVIIILIVILGTFNSVSTAILERKQEIGNLRANGESVFEIMRLLVWEGVFLGAIGAIIGVLVATVLVNGFLREGIVMPPGPGLTKEFVAMITLQWNMAYTTILMSIVAAFGATLLAGFRVAKLPVAEALRAV